MVALVFIGHSFDLPHRWAMESIPLLFSIQMIKIFVHKKTIKRIWYELLSGEGIIQWSWWCNSNFCFCEFYIRKTCIFMVYGIESACPLSLNKAIYTKGYVFYCESNIPSSNSDRCRGSAKRCEELKIDWNTIHNYKPSITHTQWLMHVHTFLGAVFIYLHADPCYLRGSPQSNYF